MMPTKKRSSFDPKDRSHYSAIRPIFTYLLILILVLLTTAIKAQTNVRTWQADGQLWMVWEFAENSPKIEIYKNDVFDLNLSSWNRIGHLFPEMAVPASMRLNMGMEDATFTIPDANGGTYTLKLNEGLFEKR